MLQTCTRLCQVGRIPDDGQWRGPVTCNEWEGEFGQYQPPCTTLMCRFVPAFIITFMAIIIAILYQELIRLIVLQIK